jgi:energy-coupling factor transport system permease protein
MQDLAYLRHLTFGQYLPRRSFVHSLDPRTKILATGALAVAISVNASYIGNALLLAAALGLAILSRVSPSKVLAGLRPAVPFIIYFSALQALFFDSPFGPTTDPVTLLDWGPFTVTTAGIRLVIVSILRLLELWILTSLLTNTTDTSALARGTESLLRPFSALGLPGHDVALVFTMSLRFLPVFALSLEDTLKAQLSRGVTWHSGRLAFIRNVRRVASLMVPLFADAIRRAQELAAAMEARCYVGDGRGRTHLLTLTFRPRDWFSLIGVIAVSAALTLARNQFPW